MNRDLGYSCDDGPPSVREEVERRMRPVLAHAAKMARQYPDCDVVGLLCQAEMRILAEVRAEFGAAEDE